MKLYNSMTGRKEEFIPLDGKNVKMYACGITVYDLSHIGHARQAIAYAMVADYLRYRGYNVKYVRNYTDVDDKIIDRANKLGKDPLEFSREQIEETEKDMANLHITDADVKPKASENIENIIEFVQGLIDKGHAYPAENGDVYFNVRSFPGYGKLSHRKVDELLNGVRKDVEEGKHDPIDFALWKAAKPGEISWKSPWGEGRPGWHIECSGISIKNLGEYLDIHTGGVDNIFPHHTNEIAQSEAYLGHKWCSYWVHTEHLMSIDGKMSKSHGDVVTVDSLINKGYNPLSFRYMCLNSHYRKQLIFSFDALNAAENEYKKLKNKIANLKEDGMLSDGDFENYTNLFTACITDDLNTANAITVIYSLLKDETVNGTTKIELIRSFDRVLALDLLKKDEAKREDHDLIMKLIEKRNNAKKSKDYELADSIRDELYSKGIKLIDTREGTTYEEV